MLIIPLWGGFYRSLFAALTKTRCRLVCTIIVGVLTMAGTPPENATAILIKERRQPH
jgi:hypothetical protein